MHSLVKNRITIQAKINIKPHLHSKQIPYELMEPPAFMDASARCWPKCANIYEMQMTQQTANSACILEEHQTSYILTHITPSSSSSYPCVEWRLRSLCIAFSLRAIIKPQIRIQIEGEQISTMSHSACMFTSTKPPYLPYPIDFFHH